ncbi:hypothetical protein [uncultured Nitratireductor sp.]|uniref:hypothetical protein n=1 Tax=uncultured Nitratireductor sp. TaxID=520953 RepID=UPI00260A09C4|nr:hypothetical protein [uncultured Nitratireductor sp.]
MTEATELTHDEATAECNALAQKLGEYQARQIMGRVVAFGIEPDEMEEMVRECVRDFLIHLMTNGADPNDAEVAAEWFYASIVKEGACLAREMTWEAGHA